MSERKCVLGSCCCGCTLRTGAWVTAIVCLICSIVNIVTSIVDATVKHHSASWGPVFINALIFVIVILLIVGIKKENSRYIFLWVYCQFVMTIIALILLVIAFILSLDIFGFIFGLVFFGITIYFILVVRSYGFEIGAIIQAANNINDAVRNSHQSSWINVVIALIMLVIAIMLFVGVYKSNPRYLWIWVYVQFVLTLIAVVTLVITGAIALAFVPIIIGVIVYGFILYFILVVRSYAIELEGTGGGNTV